MELQRENNFIKNWKKDNSWEFYLALKKIRLRENEIIDYETGQIKRYNEDVQLDTNTFKYFIVCQKCEKPFYVKDNYVNEKFCSDCDAKETPRLKTCPKCKKTFTTIYKSQAYCDKHRNINRSEQNIRENFMNFVRHNGFYNRNEAIRFMIEFFNNHKELFEKELKVFREIKEENNLKK
jgi:hypothetical protein